MRGGFSLVEVMIALVLLSVLAGPALVVLRAHDTPLSPAAVRARRLADRLVCVLEDLEPEELEALAKSEAAGAFASFDPSKVSGVNRAELEGLECKAGVRILRHAGGRFGLDRLDLELTFVDGRREQRVSRSVIRRNEPQLAALARVRLHGDVEELSDSGLADGLDYAAYQDGLNNQVGFAEGSPYPARVYPPLLAEFEPPASEDVMQERKKRLEALGDRMKMLAPYFTSAGSIPRPHFGSGMGVAH